MRAAIALALLLRGGCPGGGGGGPPEPRTCTSPSAPSTPFTVDMGDAHSPWPDGKVVQLETGGQGFRMLPVRTYVGSPSAPSCVMQDLDVRIDGQDAGGALYNLALTRNASGQYVSDAVYVIIFGPYPGAEVSVTASIAGQSTTRRWYLERLPSPADAGL